MTENVENRVVVVTGSSDWKSLTKLQLNEKLVLACTIHDSATIKQALIHGADVNCRRSDYMTPLHIAAEHGDVKMMRLLCKDPRVMLEAKTMHGLTPMHTAALLGRTQVMEELSKNGAMIYCKDNLERCPLHYAALHKNVDCAKYLIRAGSPIDVYDAFHESPLHISVLKTKNLSMIKLLIAYKVRRSPFTPNDAQRLLLEAVLSARDEYDMKIIRLILRYGGDVINLPDSIGWRTPLHIVAMTGFYALAEYLIDMGADLTAKNRAHQTPLEVALNCKHFNIARLIEDKSRSMENDLPEVSYDECENMKFVQFNMN